MPKPQLQHRHFCFIAEVIASLPESTSGPHMLRQCVAQAFTDALKGTNAAFDSGRFLDAARGTPRNRDKARG